MRAKVSYFLYAGIISVLFTSCLKNTDYPDEPIIVYTGIEKTTSGLDLNFSFTDGDGNFGLGQADTIAPFDEAPFNRNLILTYYEMQEGVWQRFGDDFPIFSPYYLATPFSAAVQWVTPTGQNKTQEGTVTFSIVDPYYNFDSLYDTCRFEFFIYDRDLNKSNTEVTDYFLKP